MVDLHTHSTASDGSLSPTALVSQAQEMGLGYLALTDHNTTRGLPEFLQAAANTSVHAIAGAEISCRLGKQELHMLALDLPSRYFSQLDQFLQEALQKAEDSKRELVDALRKAGYQICFEDIRKANPHSVINRAHIALALKEAGYVPSVDAAFQQLLRKSAGYYHPPERLHAGDVIGIIHDLDAIPVWAHPFLYLDTAGVQRVLETLVPAGLRGLEAHYSTFSTAQTQDALALSRRFGLKVSGGSDFHGTPKPDIHLGTGRGNLHIPDSIAINLLKREKETSL